jgi:hypothetical protein
MRLTLAVCTFVTILLIWWNVGSAEVYRFTRTVKLRGSEVSVRIDLEVRAWPLWRRDSRSLDFDGLPSKYLHSCTAHWLGKTASATYPAFLLEDPNAHIDLAPPSPRYKRPQYLAAYGFEDLLVIRIYGSDGGFSQVSLFIFRDGQLLKALTYPMEEYDLAVKEPEAGGLEKLARKLVGSGSRR